MARAAARGCRLLLPTDVLWSSSLDQDRDTGLQVLTPSCCTQEQPCIPPGGLRLRLRCFGLRVLDSQVPAYGCCWNTWTPCQCNLVLIS